MMSTARKVATVISAMTVAFLALLALVMPEESAYERSERIRQESCERSIYEVGGGCIYDGGYVDWSVGGEQR